MTKENRDIRYIKPEKMFDAIKSLEAGHAVTYGVFSKKVPSTMVDMEWNQMDQLHRPFVHRTYQKNIRIALGREYASSLTRWGRWPFLITVTDMHIDKGIFYSNFVLGALFFVQNIISYEEENGIITLKHEWFISSHRIFKPLQWIISRMWYKLDHRLWEEDGLIRAQRHKLRNLGYRFLHDANMNFYTANLLTNNTIYPDLPQNASIDVAAVSTDGMVKRQAGAVEFLMQRKGDELLIWPSACPHEGGDLENGKKHEDCRIECPWHGLKFTPARLSNASPEAEIYGFSYTLKENKVFVRRVEKQSAAA